jgi:hypothetical protein
LVSGTQTAKMNDEPENGIIVMKSFKNLLEWCEAQNIKSV